MEIKLQEFKKALAGFTYLINLDLKSLANQLDKRMIDGLENGMIQKFEVTVELSWKLIKKFLMQVEGIDAKTPKQSVKEFYLAGYLEESDYLILIAMIDDRNTLSHLYNETQFRIIIKKFLDYSNVLEKIAQVFTDQTKPHPQ